jgi:mannose-6-phosphate isomerase-like protein (cupin superfamily)
MRISATAALLVLLAVPAWAQEPPAPAAAPARGRGTPPPPMDLTKGTVMNAADLHAAIATAGDTNPSTITRVFGLAGDRRYTVMVEHRAPKAQAAAVHENDAELFYVIDGWGTMVTGGKLVNETRNGVNLGGTAIEGGTAVKLNKGDFFIVPEGVPHWFSELDPAGMNVMTLHLPRK